MQKAFTKFFSKDKKGPEIADPLEHFDKFVDPR
jgi:hypothetical protein